MRLRGHNKAKRNSIVDNSISNDLIKDSTRNDLIKDSTRKDLIKDSIRNDLIKDSISSEDEDLIAIPLFESKEPNSCTLEQSIDLPLKSPPSSSQTNLPIEYKIISTLTRELIHFQQVLNSPYTKCYILSFLSSDTNQILATFNASNQIDQIGALQILIQTLNKNQFVIEDCNPISCSLCSILFEKRLCRVHSHILLTDLLSLYLKMFSISFEKQIFINEAESARYWIEIKEIELLVWIDSFKYKIGSKDEFIRNCLKKRHAGALFSFNNSFNYFVSNSDYNISLKGALRKWLSRFCTIKQQTKLKESTDFPTTLSGFNKHNLYVLETKINKSQVLIPNAISCGSFRGIPVYWRRDLSQIKSQEAWTRQGRCVKQGEIPVVQRDYTPKVKKRANEQGKATLNLYAEWQTEDYVPPVAQNGIVPKNSFGNVELFCKKMLPIGCMHLPYQDIDKTAKKLGIDYADAIVGFSFKNGRAAPKTQGIVVCQEEVTRIMQAYAKYQLEMQRLLEEARLLEAEKKRKMMQKLENLIKESESVVQPAGEKEEIYRGKRKKKLPQEEFCFDKL